MKRRPRGIEVKAVLKQEKETYFSYAQIMAMTDITIFMIDWHRRHNNQINAEYFEWIDPTLSAEKIPGLSLVGFLLLVMRDDSKKALEFQSSLAKTLAHESLGLSFINGILKAANYAVS